MFGGKLSKLSYTHFVFCRLNIIILFGEWVCRGEELKERIRSETDSCSTDRCWSSNSSQLSNTTNHKTPLPFTLSLHPPPFKTSPSPPPHPHPLFLLRPRTQRHFILFKSNFGAESIQGIPQSLVCVVIARWVYRPAGSRVMRGRRVPRAPGLWCTDGLTGNKIKLAMKSSVFVLLCQVPLKAFQQICSSTSKLGLS